MRPRIKVVGVAAVAAAMMSVVSVASASALPVFVPAKGAFPVGFTSTSGASKLETVGEHVIKCTGDTNKGEISNATEVDKLVVSFTGCKSTAITEPKCETAGSAEGTIVTSALKGTLGYIKKAAPIEVGLQLVPESGTEEAKFECKTILGVHDLISALMAGVGG